MTAPQPADTAFGVDPRSERPRGTFSLVATLGVAAVATIALIAWLSAQSLPSPQLRTVMMTIWATLGIVALIVYRARAAAVDDLRLAWASAGLTVSVAAAVLQFVSHPAVFPGRGPFVTGDQQSAVLYVWFNVALFLAALGAVLRLPRRAATVYAAAGVAVSVGWAADLLPAPTLLHPDGSYSTLQQRVNLVAGLLGILAGVLWARGVARASYALDGWFGVSLMLASANLLMGIVSAARFDALWWSSLTMRVAAYGVLAIGGVLHLGHELRRAEAYTESELSRREGQLERTSSVTTSLMGSAVRLSRATAPVEVGEVVVRTLAKLTGCSRGVVTVEDPPGHVRVLVSAGYDDESLERLTRHLNEPGTGIHEMALTRTPEFVSGREQLRAGFPQLADVPAARLSGRVAAIPLMAGEAVPGVAFVADDEPREWTAQDRSVVAALVAQAGPALARAREHAKVRDTAEVLQRALLPSSLPEVPGVELTSRYLPGDSGASIGGDWYDAVGLRDGRVMLLVGDVVGKGVRAATAMGVLRQSVRVLVDVDPSPSAVLDGLERVLEGEDRSFATVVCLLLDPAAGVVTVARAGHPPPVLVEADGRTSLLDDGLSPPLGAGVPAHPQATVPMPAGSVIVLYTDGVVEDRTGDIEERLSRLRLHLSTAVASGAGLDRLADAVVASRPATHPDDIAVLVAKVCPLLSPPAADVRMPVGRRIG